MKTRYLIVTLTMLVAGAVELWRGYRPLIVVVGVAGFLVAGNLMVYRSGSRARALRRQQQLDYWTN